MAQNYYFSMAVLVLASFGVVVNVASIIILVIMRKGHQMFHHLLKILALYDLVRMKVRKVRACTYLKLFGCLNT